MPNICADYRPMAPRPASPPPSQQPSTPQWVWRDASGEGVVGARGVPTDNNR
jgi:hypothetical protein